MLAAQDARLKIVLLGGRGQLGWELRRALAPLGQLVMPRAGSPSLWSGDLGDAEGLRTMLRSERPDVVVNAAAYTNVDGAEREWQHAEAVNAQAPGLLAQEAAALGFFLVHYSSDYVFDGAGARPWSEEDMPKPLNAYGRSKLAGERAISSVGCRHLILRTSWLYAARGRNFLRAVLKLARERDRLEVVDDQKGAPTGAELLADVTAHTMRAAVADPTFGGTYHVAAAGCTDRCSYARFAVGVAEAAGMHLRLHADQIVPVASAMHPTEARRPLNSRLDTTKLRERFGLQLPVWQTGVERAVLEIADAAL